MNTPSSPVKRPAGPVLFDPRSTWLTYESFYGLTEKPFSLSSDPRFFYPSPSHASAYDELLAGILRRESLSVLTGDIGMGKTTLCRAVIESLDRKTFSAIVPDPFASREDLLKVLLMDFGVMSMGDLTSGRLKGASRTELSYLLYEFLDTLAPLQAFAVVIIDEAQNLSVPLLEEIRILSDSDGRDRQLQVVLVGQLELQQKLMLPEMRQVDQRVSVRSTLGALNRAGVGGYIAHRLQVAGASPDGVWFTSEAIDLVYGQSGGVPRLINRICDRALYEGYLRRATCIDQELVESVVSGVRPVAPAITADALSAALPAAPPAAPPAEADVFESIDEPITVVEFTINPEDDIAPVEETFAAPVEEAVSDSFMVVLPDQDHKAPMMSEATSYALESTIEGRVTYPRVAPGTRQAPRRWAQTLGVAALCLMGLGAIGATAIEVQSLRAELAAAPQLPTRPPAPPRPAMPAALTVPAVPDAETSDTPQSPEGK